MVDKVLCAWRGHIFYSLYRLIGFSCGLWTFKNLCESSLNGIMIMLMDLPKYRNVCSEYLENSGPKKKLNMCTFVLKSLHILYFPNGCILTSRLFGINKSSGLEEASFLSFMYDIAALREIILSSHHGSPWCLHSIGGKKNNLNIREDWVILTARFLEHWGSESWPHLVSLSFVIDSKTERNW